MRKKWKIHNQFVFSRQVVPVIRHKRNESSQVGLLKGDEEEHQIMDILLFILQLFVFLRNGLIKTISASVILYSQFALCRVNNERDCGT